MGEIAMSLNYQTANEVLQALKMGARIAAYNHNAAILLESGLEDDYYRIHNAAERLHDEFRFAMENGEVNG